MNSLKNFSLSWFDLAALIVLVVGLFRGRKRGMSEELLDLFQWLVMVVVSARVYEPFGELLMTYLPISRLVSYIMAYIVTLLGIKLVFTLLKRFIGEKLIGSDIFGRLEYYLGMLAGMVRFFCILLVCMALFHSRQYTAEELAATARDMQKDFDTITFPTWGSLQKEIFERSITGQFVAKHLKEQLITPTHYNPPETTAGTVSKQRKSDLDKVLEK